MKKSIILAAVAALVLASCAKTETYVKSTFDDAVTFGAYSGRTITKGGPAVDMNLDSLKVHGFGVFATYTELNAFEDLDQDKGANDNFMSNQKVAWDKTSSTWTYSPIKYWPNPTNGQSADEQKVSFFAYAPYTDSISIDTSYGVTGFSNAVAFDNPADTANSKKHVHNFVHYTFAKDKPNVDLMWGYKAKDSSVNPATYTINNNLTRKTDVIHFTFQHLLSKLGGSQEGTVTNPDSTGYVANGLIIKAAPVSSDPTAVYGNVTTGDFGGAKGTKITVSKIVVASAPEKDALRDTVVTDSKGAPVKYATGNQTGKLDLYTGEFELDGAPEPVQFIQTLSASDDSIAVGKADSRLADRIAEPDSVASFGDLPVGVTKNAVNVYKSESSPVILVPGTRPVVDVTITYIVRTYDEKLPDSYTDVPQTVFGRVKFPVIEKNKKYNLLMILGLNNVKLEATVEDWSKGSTWIDANNNGVVDDGELNGNDQEVYLPENL